MYSADPLQTQGFLEVGDSSFGVLYNVLLQLQGFFEIRDHMSGLLSTCEMKVQKLLRVLVEDADAEQ